MDCRYHYELRHFCASLMIASGAPDIQVANQMGHSRSRPPWRDSRKLARRLADHDMLDELRERASGGGSHALRELARRLAERDMDEELRDLIASADADTRLLIFDAVGESAGMKARRLVADLGHKASRVHLARRLFRKGNLDELRQRAAGGDEYAQHWLSEVLS